ncbi:alanine racemase [Kiloniella laminariae]|uniref:Alanine racemase n=1 Tax=Kiloniella laminariae TaxID=454162 RepID=A0ABT4LIL1_9PROT|nr:alanine racemase [Kiloniella laminariae]MCZ4280770.1 alanine racemase [Kiloniella laminariae]
MPFEDLGTPSLLLNRDICEENCRVMQERAQGAGVRLRPHMKTAKSIEVYKMATRGGFEGITVSTLAEADFFANAGVKDILYAVGIVPGKLAAAQKIQDKGVKLSLITDNVAVITALDAEAERLGTTFPVAVEIDCGGGRGGVLPESADLLDLARALKSSRRLSFEGVLTHAGHSYAYSSAGEIAEVAEQERLGVVSAAVRLRKAGFACPLVSAGSTPTAVFARSFEGLSEIRPGVYMFGDVDQLCIGTCKADEIAATVLTSVIGHNRSSQRLLVDAGGLALSKDISASIFTSQSGYGLVCKLDGTIIDDFFVEGVHQEHGLIASLSGDLCFESYPVGSRLRILPIHSCMTVAAYEHYEVHDSPGSLIARWSRVNGW